MTQKINFRIPSILLGLCGLVLVGATPILAGICGSRCPSCECRTCEPVAVTTSVEKSCFEVVCKDICIPSFKWPWESCCDLPGSGQVRTIKQLKKVTYKCEKCGYKWEAPSTSCKSEK